jgi:hypothetical protein
MQEKVRFLFERGIAVVEHYISHCLLFYYDLSDGSVE